MFCQTTTMTLEGKVFIITGAGGAISSAINTAFKTSGALLALADRPGNAERARDQLGTGLAIPVDLASLEGAHAMVAATLAHYGRVDGLIHTVGSFATGKILELKPEDLDRMFDLNVKTLAYAVVAALPEIDPAHIGVMGSSFGGTTTLLAASKSKAFRCVAWRQRMTLRFRLYF